jgi:hypothetical protein
VVAHLDDDGFVAAELINEAVFALTSFSAGNVRAVGALHWRGAQQQIGGLHERPLSVRRDQVRNQQSVEWTEVASLGHAGT